MKILIIEDEPLAANRLEKMVYEELDRPINELIKLESVEEGIQWFSENESPDLVFCDIHLSDGNCFEIFEEVTVSAPIIFTTAFDEYAIKAFKFHSIDYLLKPIDKTEIRHAITKFDQLQNTRSTSIELIQEYFLKQEKSDSYKERISAKKGETIRSISLEQVAYFYADAGVVFLVTYSNERYWVEYTLNDLEQLINPKLFFRVNRQFIVQINAVKEVKPYFKGRLSINIEPKPKDMSDIIISQKKAGSFKDWLDGDGS